MANLVWAEVERYLVVVHNEQNPSNQDFEGFLAYSAAFGIPQGVLVYSAGGSLGALQRKRLRDSLSSLPGAPPLEEGTTRTAMLTSSLPARLTITAMNLFFNNSMRAFAPTALAEAFAFVGTPERLQPSVRQKMSELMQSLRLTHPW